MAKKSREFWRVISIVPWLAGALVTSPFFQGANGDLLVATQIFLLIGVVAVLWQGYVDGIAIPRSHLAVAITFYWLWLAITLFWSRVPFYSTYTFWWMSALPLSFWLYALIPDREGVWRYTAAASLLVGLGLATTGIMQLHVFGETPQAMFLNINSYAGLLNIIAIPTAAYFLISLTAESSRDSRKILLGTALFVFAYAVGITKGRGALLAFILGMALVLGVAARHVSWRVIAKAALLIVLALGLANLSLQAGLVDRMQTLSDPVSAGWGRFLIWQASWELLQESPWRGIGLGIYSLAWPPYRHPDDGSAGFFAHNDYLHLWIEAGLPGLILFVAVLVSAFWIFIRALRRHMGSGAQTIELTGLTAAVMAIAFHSMFDFNFYIVPILILTGLALARMQGLADEFEGAKPWVIEPRRWLTRGGYRTIVVLLAAFPLLYFVTLALSAYETRRAVELGKDGRLDEAEIALFRAARFYPYADSTLMSHADLYRHALTVLPPTAAAHRQLLFERANELLDSALKLNPLRVQTFVVRAQLYEQNRELAGKEWIALAREQYKQAIRLNPRHFEARFLYARSLHATGESRAARMVLEDGLRYSHASHAGLIPYYVLTAKLRANEGDQKGAEEMQQRVKELQSAMAKDAPSPNTPAAAAPKSGS